MEFEALCCGCLFIQQKIRLSSGYRVLPLATVLVISIMPAARWPDRLRSSAELRLRGDSPARHVHRTRARTPPDRDKGSDLGLLLGGDVRTYVGQVAGYIYGWVGYWALRLVTESCPQPTNSIAHAAGRSRKNLLPAPVSANPESDAPSKKKKKKS
jgi:hypothetical protein